VSGTVIVTRDVRKVFRRGEVEIEALRGVSTEVAPSEFVAIAGPSGSGKSTFMNILGCLDHPTKGTYHLAGRDVSTLTADERAEIRNREIGFVFQAFNLIPRMSALENVELPLFYSEISPAEQRGRAREMLASVGLEERAEHQPSQLSGGEQQRVAIARALVNRPRLLLADEPTGNLDTTRSHEIMEILARLNHEQGLTVVLVTHENEIARYARRMLVFRDGLVTEDVQQDHEDRTASAGERSLVGRSA
jgi:putative ABC transport system ATP-binding protein